MVVVYHSVVLGGKNDARKNKVESVMQKKLLNFLIPALLNADKSAD